MEYYKIQSIYNSMPDRYKTYGDTPTKEQVTMDVDAYLEACHENLPVIEH